MKRVVINTESVNRSGFRILNKGGKLDNYAKNPILLYGHDRNNHLPIGTLKELKVEGGVLSGLPEFDTTDEFAMKVQAKWENGVLNAASMGIDVLAVSTADTDKVEGQTRGTVTAWELLEVSIVDIPRNQDCVKLSANGSEAQIDDIVPIIVSQKNKTMSLDKTAQLLQLKADASDDQLSAGVEAILKSRTDLLLTYGRNKGIVTDENEAQYRKLAAADYESTLALLDAKPAAETKKEGGVEKPLTVQAILAAAAAANQGQQGQKDANDKSTWDFETFSKKDPDGLLQLKREKPEAYAALAGAYKA